MKNCYSAQRQKECLEMGRSFEAQIQKHFEGQSFRKATNWEDRYQKKDFLIWPDKSYEICCQAKAPGTVAYYTHEITARGGATGCSVRPSVRYTCKGYKDGFLWIKNSEVEKYRREKYPYNPDNVAKRCGVGIYASRGHGDLIIGLNIEEMIKDLSLSFLRFKQ
jgi:hypothetical protein